MIDKLISKNSLYGYVYFNGEAKCDLTTAKRELEKSLIYPIYNSYDFL